MATKFRLIQFDMRVQNLIILIVIIVLFPGISHSQPKMNPQYFLNSVKVEMEGLYINPKSIDSIGINRDTANGEIRMYTKSGGVKLLSADEVLAKYSEVKVVSGDVLLRINGKFVDNVSNVRIDDSYFVYIEVNNLAENRYLSPKYKDLVIVDVALETEERKPEIYIRGE